MPKLDIYHEVVKQALVKDGWTITHDPFALSFGDHNLFVDLGAERLVAAEKGEQRIAVEITSFISLSPVTDLENALGQYMLYRSLLSRRESARSLYLAIPINTFEGIFSSPLGQVTVQDHALKLIVFDPEQEVIDQWIS